jgi:hypothetical protein
VSVAPGAVLEIAEHLQLLQLREGVQVVARSEQGWPVLVESRVGRGRYLHAPLLLGRSIQRGLPGALQLFGQVFERLSDALVPAARVLEKPRLVDVSVLIGAHGEPTLIGISNYRHEPSEVEVELPAGSALRFDEADAALLLPGRSAASRRIRLPARSSAALLIDPARDGS